MRRLVTKSEPEAYLQVEHATNEKYEEFGLMDLHENRSNFAFEFRKDGKAQVIPAEYGNMMAH